MKINELTKDELESMPYDEIAYLVLLESGKKEKLLNLYKKVCKLLNLKFNDETDKIADFFEILSTNKKFVMLKNGYWDLQVNHKSELMLDDTEEEIFDEEELEELEQLEETVENGAEEDIFYDAEDTDDTVEDDLADLVVITNEEDENN